MDCDNLKAKVSKHFTDGPKVTVSEQAKDIAPINSVRLHIDHIRPDPEAAQHDMITCIKTKPPSSPLYNQKTICSELIFFSVTFLELCTL